MPLASAHRIAFDAEAAIRARFPGADITIHQDPASLGVEPEDIMATEAPLAAPSER